jgi:Restriction endonuclease
MGITPRKPGQQLEQLVAMLESALTNGAAKIESPSRRLIDRDTGQRREHDVLIIWDHGHHEIFTAIECRDRSRPVGVPDIEAFADKCSATGIHSRIVVSASGFRATARKKAASRTITCMDISEVSQFAWIAPSAAIFGYERQFQAMNVQIMFADDMPTDIIAIFDTNGQELTNEQITQTIINLVPDCKDRDEEVGVSVPMNMKVTTIGWSARDSDGKTWKIDHLLASTSYTTIKTAQEFSSHRYSGGGKDYQIASAEVPVSAIKGRIILLRNDDESTSVIWTPDNHGKILKV